MMLSNNCEEMVQLIKSFPKSEEIIEKILRKRKNSSKLYKLGEQHLSAAMKSELSCYTGKFIQHTDLENPLCWGNTYAYVSSHDCWVTRLVPLKSDVDASLFDCTAFNH